jgi:type VI secretion system protein VasG
VEKDAALTRRFQVVKVDEPSEDVAQAMLRGLVPALERHHQVRILEEAVAAAVQLAKRYLPERQLPDKSVSLLDTACARVRLNQTATPAAIEAIDKRLQQLQDKTSLLQREAASGADHAQVLDQLAADQHALQQQLSELTQRWQAEQQLVQAIQSLRTLLEQTTEAKNRKTDLQQLKKLERQLGKLQGEQGLLQGSVDAEAIASVIADWTAIPVGRMLQDEIRSVQQLDQHLQQRIIGQQGAIQVISEQIQAARAGLTDPGKPTGVFLLLGSSGVGKTETALALADLLYGGEQALTVINMSEFKEEHKVALLTGSPPGYVGYGEGGVLTEAVRRRPYSVILLDEMEKAHPGVQDIFYQVFDKGMLMDGEGRWVDFKNTLILMTSNACSEHLLNLPEPVLAANGHELADRLRPELLQSFKAAFLGRVTLVPYLPLAQDALTNIVQLKLAKLASRVANRYGAELNYPLELVAHIAKRCQVKESGARNIDTLLNLQLLPRLSEQLLQAAAKRKVIKQVQLGLENDILTVQQVG